MNRPSFIEGLVFAFMVSLSASFLYASLTWVLSGFGALQFLITIISVSYVVYMLLRSKEKTGRITVMLTWFLVASGLLVFDVPLSLFCLAHLVMLWVVRSLYYYSSVISSLLDFALIGTSLLFSTWAYYQTGSVFMSIWSFFITQALFVFIPERMRSTATNQLPVSNYHEFNQALKNANYAIQKLTVTK